MINRDFPIRKDQYGYRYVFFLGNEGGNCKYQCRFCEIGKSNAVDSAYNIMLFDHLYNDYKMNLQGHITHPLLYNRGNISDEKAFSLKTLTYILNKFNSDKNIHHISLNSREKEIDTTFINYLLEANLSFPIHFILGQESFSSKIVNIIGKNTIGEFEKLVEKISPYNKEYYIPRFKKYNFGVDINLLFLPELYIGNVNRWKYKDEVSIGLMKDINYALNYSTDSFPLVININPYYKVSTLPYENADIELLISLLPSISELVHGINKKRTYKISIFIGYRPIKAYNDLYSQKIAENEQAINLFNQIFW